jgi:hypothetical protein
MSLAEDKPRDKRKADTIKRPTTEKKTVSILAFFVCEKCLTVRK